MKNIRAEYDLTYILLLDSSDVNLFENLNNNIVESFRNYSPGLQIDESTVGFYTEKSDIKNVFIDSRLRARIIECVHTENSLDVKYVSIATIVYIKDNKAVFEITGPNWEKTYFATLKKNVFQISWLGGMEWFVDGSVD